MWVSKIITILVYISVTIIKTTDSFKLGIKNENREDSANNSEINSEESTKLFGESCSKNSDCQPNFICSRDNLCSCPENRIPHKHKGIWSIAKKVSCDIPAGQTCISNNFNELGTFKTFGEIKKFGDLVWNKLGLGGDNKGKKNCVENSRCDGKTCVCNPGYYKNASSGNCVHQRSMFQQCNKKDEECQDSLVCNNQRGRCECTSDLTFDIRSLQCHIPAGRSCDEFPTEQNTCIPNSDCVDQRCQCKFGYRRGSDGTCALDYGLPCDQDYFCADLDLVCRSGRCVCKYWAHQYYDDDLEECVGKVSAPCDLTINAPDVPITSSNNTLFLSFKGLKSRMKCTDNAHCVPRGQRSALSECQCLPTYAEDKDGKCIKSLGAACNADQDCDEMAQLVCLNGKCACPDELQAFSLDSRRCQGLVGSRCTRNSSMIFAFREEGIPTECVQGAVCDQKVEGLDGRCTCKDGYEVNLQIRACERKSSKFIYDWNNIN